MLDDVISFLLWLLHYPVRLVAGAWFYLIEWLIEIIGNKAPEVMPSIPDAPQSVSWPRVWIACVLFIAGVAIINGLLATFTWLGFLHMVVAIVLGTLVSLALLGGTIETLYRLIIDPPRARRASKPANEQA